MKQFTKFVFASMIGTFLAFGFMFVVLVSMITVMSMGAGTSDWEEEMGAVKDNSVLRVVLDGPLKDHIEKRDLFSSILKYDEPPVTGLYELSQVLKKAAKDDQIKGLFLYFKSFQSGMANAEALRRHVEEFKSSGKFVIAYSEVYSELSYMVASAADEVILYPKGFFEWDGLFAKVSYLQNTMSKLEVKPQVFRVGKYKSAVEPFISEEMSQESREQVDAILSTGWDRLLTHASQKTKVDPEQLNQYADNMAVLYANEAFEKGFVNLLASYEEVEQKLTELTAAEDKPRFTSWRAYYRNDVKNTALIKDDKVALVFASGGIRSEENGDDDVISSEALSELINKLRRDEKVKAVVFRVNSPGGSALASDVIWTSTQWLKDSKPVVTSFGNVAASGGYYMSAGSQYIFAEPTTITGSIGVFALGFATKQFWNNKIGMTFSTVKSHRFADLGSLVRTYDPEESAKMQDMVNHIYEDFLNVVDKGRESLESRQAVHDVAQGRVWTGEKAKELGLVDDMGGIDEAVAKAAELAQLTDYDVEIFPKERSAFEEFLFQFGGISTVLLKSWLPESLQTLLPLNTEASLKDQVKARLPFEININ